MKLALDIARLVKGPSPPLAPVDDVQRRTTLCVVLFLSLCLAFPLVRQLFAVTPSTIRIQSIESPQRGNWVVMPGFSELGSPTFSRDGQWIAFDAYKEGFNNSRAECWIARRDGRDLTRLAYGATPRWSPDGKQLLFVREAVNDRSVPEGIYLINRDGSGERRIGDGRWPDWSPDGKSIVFSVSGDETGGARVGATICVAKADGSERQKIADGDCPSWSPDGTKIAYCYRSPTEAPVIRVYFLRENVEVTLGVGWFRANWWSDSKFVVANGKIRDSRERQIVRMQLNTPDKPTELFTEFDEPSSPCCSWDGKDLVFIAQKPRS
jgi:Tol biopolymer transport system component